MPVQRKIKKKDLKEFKNANAEKNQDKRSNTEKFVSKIPWTKVLYRIMLSFTIVFVVYWTSKENIEVFASQKDKLQLNSATVPCSQSYLEDISKFKGCAPKQCGRFVSDIVITSEEAEALLMLCKKGLALGGSPGGASVLDLHSGSLSYDNHFINIYEKLKSMDQNSIFTSQDFKIYKTVRSKIQQIIAYSFGIPANTLYLTHPTFFSEMTAREAQTKHDEYWHVHIDKETYPSFHYTSLLYLTDYGTDFNGGRFIFVDDKKNKTVEPRVGRVSAFTSGAENPHYVEKVSSGTLYALTVSFTCDPKLAIKDPTTQKFQ